MIYVKDQNNTTVRLLKTNPHGVFATYNKLSPGAYSFEIKDPKGGYFFDISNQEYAKFTDKKILGLTNGYFLAKFRLKRKFLE